MCTILSSESVEKSRTRLTQIVSLHFFLRHVWPESRSLCVAAEKQLEADPAAAELHPDASGHLIFRRFTLRPVFNTNLH